MIEQKCLFCLRSFQAKTFQKQYCSKLCVDRNYKANHRQELRDYKKKLYWSSPTIPHKRKTKVTISDEGYCLLELAHGLVALVDRQDKDLLESAIWHTADLYVKNGKHQYLHRLILNAPRSMQVDHINRNPLDNRRSNLRLATASQNRVNNDKLSNNTSGYKGVERVKNGRWTARIRFKNQKYYLGCFDSPEEAAQAYDRKAIELHGEFASLNLLKQ